MAINSLLEILQIIQAITAIISLPFLMLSVWILQRQTREVAQQTKLSADATKASIYSNINAQMIEIDRFFFDHPEIKPYFYGNAEFSKENPDYERILSVAEMLMDFMDNAFMLMPHMPDFPWETTWIRYFNDLIVSSPALQKFWVDNREWYTDQIEKYYPNEMKKILESPFLK